MPYQPILHQHEHKRNNFKNSFWNVQYSMPYHTQLPLWSKLMNKSLKRQTCKEKRTLSPIISTSIQFLMQSHLIEWKCDKKVMMRASIAVNTSDQLNFIQFSFSFQINHNCLFRVNYIFIVQRLDICLGNEKKQRAMNLMLEHKFFLNNKIKTKTLTWTHRSWFDKNVVWKKKSLFIFDKKEFIMTLQDLEGNQCYFPPDLHWRRTNETAGSRNLCWNIFLTIVI